MELKPGALAMEILLLDLLLCCSLTVIRGELKQFFLRFFHGSEVLKSLYRHEQCETK